MQNWDEAEEVGNTNCSVQQDFADAKAACDKLSIPLHTANFVPQYWTEVFSPSIAKVAIKNTPTLLRYRLEVAQEVSLLKLQNSVLHIQLCGYFSRYKAVLDQQAERSCWNSCASHCNVQRIAFLCKHLSTGHKFGAVWKRPNPQPRPTLQ